MSHHDHNHGCFPDVSPTSHPREVLQAIQKAFEANDHETVVSVMDKIHGMGYYLRVAGLHTLPLPPDEPAPSVPPVPTPPAPAPSVPPATPDPTPPPAPEV